MSGKVADEELEGWPLNLMQSTGQDRRSARVYTFIYTYVTEKHSKKTIFTLPIGQIISTISINDPFFSTYILIRCIAITTITIVFRHQMLEA